MRGIKFQKNISLSGRTTFQIGGPAKYFFIAENTGDLIKAVAFAKEKALPYFILGGGSNVLVSDNGFDGIIIKIQNTKYKIQDTKIIAEAGTSLGELVTTSVKKGLTGLEWAIGIPGTIGGAIKVNAHAFGSDISSLVKNIKKENNIIFSVELEFKKGDKEESKKLIKKYIAKRKNTQPLNYPSAGCIFKNPDGYFAGKLIEDCGLKGKQIGKAMISKKHANFIINLGGARANDVARLIALAKKSVKEKFNLDLKEEIQRVGF